MDIKTLLSRKGLVLGHLVLACSMAVSAQCPYDNVPYLSSPAPTSVGVPVTLTTCLYGGEYRTVTGLVAGATYSFETCGDTDFDTELTVYTAGGSTFLVENDDFCGTQSYVEVTLGAGGDVDVLLDQYPCTSNSICMTLVATLVSLPAPPPPNDDCAFATALSVGSTSATTVNATGVDEDDCAFLNTEDVWYTYTNTSGAPVTVSLETGSSDFDPTLSAFSGVCGGLLQLACNDDGAGAPDARVEVSCLPDGETVYFRLAGYNGQEGNTTLNLTATPDASAPSITCPGNITVNADAGFCSAYVNYLPPHADSSGAGNYTGGGILYDPIPGTGAAVTLSDDAVSGALPIGFSFPFYGSAYTNAYLSSNGFLSFDPAVPNGCCSGQDIPDAAAPNNLVAFAWEDLNPSAGGSFDYFTTGSAPDRVFVLNVNAVPHYPSGNAVTTQIQLHEGSGVIEIHTLDMPSDGGLHTMGIENADGSAATFVTGRNAADWSASSEAIQFVPPNNASDNCGEQGVFTELVSGIGFSGFYPVGTTTETWRVTDANGNTQTCSFDVTVVDNQAPTVASCPSPVTAVSDLADCGGAVVNYTHALSDNCYGTGPGTLTAGLASGSVFPIGVTNVAWTLDDGVNPPATCAFTVTVTETGAPLSTDLTALGGCGTCSYTDGETRTVFDQNGDYIATLRDDPALPTALGSTEVCNLQPAVTSTPDEFGTGVPILGRFWRVDPTVNGPADFTVHFSAAEYAALAAHPDAVGEYAVATTDDLCFTAFPTGTGPGWPTPGAVAVSATSIVDNGDGTYTAELVMNGFSDVYCHACSRFGGPLPVELLFFDGHPEQGRNELYWATATERNSHRFELERGVDGIGFERIGTVPAAGQSTQRQDYAFTDGELLADAYYYRLRQVDLDGTEAFSRVIRLSRAGQDGGRLVAWPNPTAGTLRLRLDGPSAEGPLLATVRDAAGRTVRLERLDAPAGQVWTLRLDGLPEGWYPVELRAEDGRRWRVPVLVARP